MNSSRPLKFTIATVTYNAESTLRRTLDSVAGQTYAHVEHLIIDGCSSDGTMTLIHRYVDGNAGKPHHIVVIREPDKGLYDAMNKALANATGHYIVFLNAGDSLHAPDTLERLAAQAGERSDRWPAVIYGETDVVDGQGRFVRHRRLATPEVLTWRSFRWGMLVCHQSFYVRTDLARSETYNMAYRFSADFDWCVRLLKRAPRLGGIVNSRQVLTDYLSEGLTTRHHSASLRERFRIMAHHYGLADTLWQHALFVVRAAVKK